jgi:hypothetical protein
MAVRDDFAPGEVLAAADLNDTFGSKLNIAGGKILQIVRATDSTLRTTTSTSFVDVTGMSVTITPQKSDSAVIVVAIGYSAATSTLDTFNYVKYRITDSSNNSISGAQEMVLGVNDFTGSGTRGAFTNLNLWGYDTPAVITAVTYKLRFAVDSASVSGQLRNGTNTGQIYAIEVSA